MRTTRGARNPNLLVDITHASHVCDPSAHASDRWRKLWETLRQRSQNLAIWASQRKEKVLGG